MKNWQQRILEQWSLGVVVLLVFLAASSGYWPGIPLPFRRAVTASPGGVKPELIVDWLVSPAAQDGEQLYSSPNGLQHFVVQSASGGDRAVHTQSQLAAWNDRLIIAWASHPDTINGDGQAIRIAWSTDGTRWTEVGTISPPQPSAGSAGNLQTLLVPAPFLEWNDRLFLGASLQEIVGYTTPDGLAYGLPEADEWSARYSLPVRNGRGFLLREVFSDFSLGDPFWVGEQPLVAEAARPGIAEGRDLEPGATEAWLDRLRDPLLRYPGDIEFNPVETLAADRRRLLWYATAKPNLEVAYRLWVPEPGSNRLYSQMSGDQGRTWSGGQPTEIPSAGAPIHIGRLPGGQFFLFGNQANANVGDALDPLMLSVAYEWLQFTQPFVVRSSLPRSNRVAAGVGRVDPMTLGFEPNSWVLFDQSVWLSYSVNSEAIHVSRVPVDSLVPVSP